jgi:cytochrome b pre-mRNA-processing protein 3
MFSALRKEKPVRTTAVALYEAAMSGSREPVFYEKLAVPDTMDGRFDLLLVHLFLILHRLLDGGESPLPQALFDVCFADVDQALRETGVGDMKISKHMKKMMLAFNGRMHAYEEALTHTGPDALEEALRRNLFGTLDPVPAGAVSGVAAYIRANIDILKGQGLEDISAGRLRFQAPVKGA